MKSLLAGATLLALFLSPVSVIAQTGGSGLFTIGESTITPLDDNGNANLLIAQNATLSQSATIQSLSFYVTNPAGSLRLGIYDATGPGGGPGAKRAETNSFTPVAGWNTAAVITPVSLPAGTYWIAYLPSDNNLGFRKDFTAGVGGKFYTYAYAAMPATFSSSPNTSTAHWSLYATLDTGTGTPPPVTPTASLSASSASITSGSASTLTWSSTNATSCTASNGWTGTKTTSGTQSVTPTVSTTYTLTCSGAGGTSAPQSTIVTVNTVVTPPPPPPPSPTPSPSGSNALSTLAASMSPGTWAQLTASSQDTVLGVGAVSGTMIHYSNSMPWNPITKKIEIIAMDHNWPNGLRYVQYDAATNQFVFLQDGIDGTGISHGFDHQTLNPFTGDLYHRVYSGYSGAISTKKKLLNSSSFTSLPNILTTEQVAIGTTWWSGSFVGGGSQGSYMIFNSGNALGTANDGQILAYNPLTNTWFFNKEGMAPNYMTSGSTYGSVMEYSPVKNVAVYGGGNDAPSKLWRLNADGTFTPMPNVPAGKSVGIQQGNLVNDPVSGNFLLLSQGELWELNPDGAGTWTFKGNSPSGVGTVNYPSPDGIISSSISDYGVVAYIKQTSQSGGTFYLYKPASSGTPPPTTPTASLTASPASITSGTASTLTWSSTNATSCTASNGWTGTKTTSGTLSVTPTVTTTYTITCTGAGGTSLPQSASVTVTTPTPVNGSCGSANGTTVSSAPTTNLCTAGTASSVTGTGPWTWSCAGTSGGTTASCSANLTPPVSTKFVIGDRVQVSSGPLNVRATANTTGTLLGTQATGIQGTVVSGPTLQGGFSWWNVNFDSGVDGYAAEDFMVKASVVTPPPPPPPSPSPLPASDFSTRCSATGVVKCVSFDTTADFNTGSGGTSGAYAQNFGILPPFGTSDYTKATRDTTLSASGASSLKFTIPANAGSDSSGAWFTNFSSDLNTQFDAGQEFYVQWRQRFSPEFITNKYQGSGGWKQVVVGTGDQPGVLASSCTALEIPVQNTYLRGFPIMYNSCTGSASHGPYDPFEQPFSSPANFYDFKLQNAMPSPYCLYSQSATGYFPPNGNCYGYVPNEWMTFQMHIQLGQRVGDEFQNSHVDLWLAREGQPSVQLFNWGPYNLAAGPVGENQKFGKIWLLPYQTGKDSTVTYPVAYTWYDDLIISRNKVADPASSGTVTPTPPPPPPTPVNGSCGSANGTTVSSAPTTNLCTAGTASSVTGTGPWTWSCAGTSGGTTASCSANLTPPVSTKFVIGDRVQVSSGPLNVRATANTTGTLLGTQATGIQGTVVSGPTLQGGFSWWNVNFDSGVDGYAAEDFMVKAPAPTPTATLSAAPASITSGSASTLTWSATNATSCTASNGWSGTKTTSGTLSVTPTVTTTYTITCTGSGGSSLPQSASVTVTTPTPPPPSPTPTPIPVVTLSVTPTTGTVNSVNPVLTWSVTGSPTSCTASGDWTGTKATSGVSALQGILTTVRTYSYTLICSNAGGASLPKSASVVVSGAPVTPPAPTPPPPAPAPSPSPSSGGGGGGGSTPTPPPPSPSPSSGGGGGGSFTPPPPTPAPKPHVTLTKDLTLGSTGTEVTALQQFLVQTGYLTESYTSSTFDTPTQTAVGKYQCANAITCSGVPGKFGYGNVGPVTRASMASGSTGGSVTPTPAPTPLPSGTTTPKVTLTKNLSRGAKGLEVTLLQNFLIQSGYLAAGSATGYYGPLTQKAVQAYQCAKGIACSGTPASNGYGAVGPKTRRMMGG